MKRSLAINGKSISAPLAVALLGFCAPIALGADARHPARHHDSRPLTLRATPGSRTIAPGITARYSVIIRRHHFRGTVALWIGRGLPRRAYARFMPHASRRSRSTLIITTSRRTRPGRYRLRLRATSGRRRATIAVTLKIQARGGGGGTDPVSSAPFTIAGNAADLQPGVMQALDLSLTNPNSAPLSVTSLAMTADSVDAPRATPSLPCTLADFFVRQFSGSYPLIIPGSSTRTLSELGIPSAEWPQLAIIDTPSDQDGCQGASLALSYSGTATL